MVWVWMLHSLVFNSSCWRQHPPEDHFMTSLHCGSNSALLHTLLLCVFKGHWVGISVLVINIFFFFLLFQPREKGRMRFHRLQNVQIALDFLKQRQVNKTQHMFGSKGRCSLFGQFWCIYIIYTYIISWEAPSLSWSQPFIIHSSISLLNDTSPIFKD